MERSDHRQSKHYHEQRDSRQQRYKGSRSRSHSQDRHQRYEKPQRQSRFAQPEQNYSQFPQDQEQQKRFQERQERFQARTYDRPQESQHSRQDRFQERPDRFQERPDRFQERPDRFQERPDRFQERPDRFQEKQSRFQDRQQDRFQDKSTRFQDKPDRFQDRQPSNRFSDQPQRDRNPNFQFQRQSNDQQDNNYQQRRQQYQGGGNRNQGRQQFNKGRQNKNQQQQQQQPPQKLYYYEQLQQQNEEFIKSIQAQQAIQQQIAQGEIPDQNIENQQPQQSTTEQLNEQQQQQQQQEQGINMIANLNEIEKLKNEFNPQKSQEQFKEQIQENYNYKWDEWEEESDLINTMDNELNKLLGKRVKIRIPPDIATNMGNINIQITKTEEIPEKDEDFNPSQKEEEITQLIEQLSPYQQQWENLTSLLINEFELIDMYRKPELASKRYSIPIVNYSSGSSKLGQIFARDYFKLWELLFRFKLLDKFQGQPLEIANLAEGQGPGGFINCLVDYRNRQNQINWKFDKYVGMTMKNKDKKNLSVYDWDYFKTKKYMTGLDQQGYSINLTYGASQDGDMLNTQNLIFFINYELKDKATNQIKKCHIVTANGGTEYSLFNNEQENEELINAKLFFAEVATALAIQAKGGFFIMKIFNTQHQITRNILTLLAKYYKKVFIVKPYISHPVSNERYVVCDDFIGIDQNVNEKLLGVLQEWTESENIFDYSSSEMFFNKFLEFEQNPSSKFIENLKKSNEEIINCQIEKLKQSVNLLTNPVTPDIIKNIKQHQFEQAKKWCIKFEIPYLFKLEGI